ncbi:MAG TPA: heavy metal translocating P-type ATPase, partial [Kineosporiaceae bacterium]
MARAWLAEHGEGAFFGASCGLLGIGVVGWGLDAQPVAVGAWVTAAVLGLVFSTVSLVQAAVHRRPSVDVIAWLALAGALATGEAFAGAVLAVMLASGALLEARAAARARRELSLLVERAPRTARRRSGDAVVEVPVEQVARGDLLLVGPGEVVPVDGRLVTGAVLDESALTGESMPVERAAGEDVRSGVTNAGQPLELLATATARESTYAGVVRLVEQAQASSAPFVRAADRYAIGFVPLTLAIAALAWLLTGDVVRAVAVLVVATPCPLLLAAPIAIISGVSRAARRGVVVKGGAALEQLAAGRVMLFDKTGTLTAGRPILTDVITPAGQNVVDAQQVLRLAASLEQVSPHVLAGAVVTAARHRGLTLEMPTDVREHHGHGLEGTVAGRRVRLGKAEWIVPGETPAWIRNARRRAALDGFLAVYVAVDDAPAGALLLEDPIRPDAPRMIRALRTAGITRTVLVTGDRADMAETVGRIVGVDAVWAERDPAEKLAIVTEESTTQPTIMVGDGVNDAPALAAASVGVALAARGATASSEAADVVLTVDRIDALADAILVARRSRRIAVQAVVVGMGLSLVAMLAAALGHLTPALGAVAQEGIDVLAIGIALLAVLPGARHTVTIPAADLETIRKVQAEHASVRSIVERIRVVADTLDPAVPDLAPVQALLERLDSHLLPHERAEQELIYPLVAKALGTADPTGILGRTHAEIEHQVGRLRRLLPHADTQPGSEDIHDLRRILYGLYAILRLHNTQEEEEVFSLIPEDTST